MVPHITSPIHVLVIQHLPLMRAALVHMLAHLSGLIVVGEVASCANALAIQEQKHVDLIVFDPDPLHEPLAPDTGDALMMLARTPMLVLTYGCCGKGYYEMIQAGIRGIVLKAQPLDAFDKAIATVVAGSTWFDPSLSTGSHVEVRQSPHHIEQGENFSRSRLTPQEWNIVRLVCEGLSNNEISCRLALSDITIRHHLTRIYRKLGVDSRLRLVVYAYQHGHV